MKPTKVYMCGVDWQHEADSIASTIYPSVESLKKNRPCWEQCGIVCIEVKEAQWVVEQNFDKLSERKGDA